MIPTGTFSGNVYTRYLNPDYTVFSRFNLTETDSFGILPTDMNDVEAYDLNLEVKAKNKAARGLAKSKSKKSKKRPKTKPKTSPLP